VSVHAFLLGETLLHVPAVRQYQMSPTTDGLRVRVVLREGAPQRETMMVARRAIAAELRRLGAVVRTLAVEPVKRIDRVGTGAKERLVTAA
jgi:hypothetical protein